MKSIWQDLEIIIFRVQEISTSRNLLELTKLHFFDEAFQTFLVSHSLNETLKRHCVEPVLTQDAQAPELRS